MTTKARLTKLEKQAGKNSELTYVVLRRDENGNITDMAGNPYQPRTGENVIHLQWADEPPPPPARIG